jgi:hypothetical protein
VVAGVGVTVAPVLLPALMSSDGGNLLVLVLIGTPAAVGGTVCSLGRLSKHYDGQCGHAMLGAYLGALTIIPIAIWANSNSAQSGDDVTPLLAVGVAWFIVQPVAATFAWHLGKRWRPAPPALSRRDGFLRLPERGRTRAPGEVTVPLLSLSF